MSISSCLNTLLNFSMTEKEARNTLLKANRIVDPIPASPSPTNNNGFYFPQDQAQRALQEEG